MSGELGSATIKMAGSLILILGLIFFVFYWLKRIRFGPLSPGSNPRMRVLGTMNLAPKRGVSLIEVCDQWFLLGIGTDNVSLISRIEPPDDIEPADGVSTGEGNTFHSLLQRSGILQSRKRTRMEGGEGES